MSGQVCYLVGHVTVTYTISTGHVGAVHRSLNSFIFAEFYLTLLGDAFVDP